MTTETPTAPAEGAPRTRSRFLVLVPVALNVDDMMKELSAADPHTVPFAVTAHLGTALDSPADVDYLMEAYVGDVQDVSSPAPDAETWAARVCDLVAATFRAAGWDLSTGADDPVLQPMDGQHLIGLTVGDHALSISISPTP